jgi:hypothetical protein
MSDERYIYHVTVTTGHARRSHRKEITPEALEIISTLLQQLESAQGQRVTVPGPSGYEISGRVSGHCMTAKVFKRGSFDALVSIAIADRERCGAALWNEVGNNKPQPDAPWLAVRLEGALTTDLDESAWLGDFERCLAWAFIDSLN